MKMGVRIPCYRAWVRGAEVRRLAVMAEDLGFDSLWVHDHLVAPATPVADVLPLAGGSHASGDGRRLTAEEYYAGEAWWLDPFAVWGFLCAATSRVQLGSDIIVAPYRNPIVQAKLLGTLDVLSNGRMIYGVGTGHVESEARTLGISPEAYAARGKVTDDYLEVIIALLSRDPASFEGTHYTLEPVRPLITPVQKPHPPIYVGGNGKPAIRRAARLGQAWLPSNLAPEEIRAGADYLREQSAQGGRQDPPGVAISLSMKIRQGPSKGARPGYSVDEACALLRAYAAAGVQHVSLDFPNRNEDILTEQFDLFSGQVRPELVAGANA